MLGNSVYSIYFLSSLLVIIVYWLLNPLKIYLNMSLNKPAVLPVTVSTTHEENQMNLSVSSQNYHHNGIQASIADDSYFTSPHPPDQPHSPPGAKVSISLALDLFLFIFGFFLLSTSSSSSSSSSSSLSLPDICPWIFHYCFLLSSLRLDFAFSFFLILFFNVYRYCLETVFHVLTLIEHQGKNLD